MTVNSAQGSRLALVQPGDTADHLAFTAFLATEVTRILVCNVSAGARTFRFYHTTGAAAFSAANAIWWDMSVAAGATFDFAIQSDNGGLQMAKDDTLGVRSSVASDLVFHIYGVTASIAPVNR